MEQPTEDERKRWWLLCYGVTSMEKACTTCDLLIDHCPDNTHPMFPALTLAVHSYYVRPFKRNSGVGRLPIEMVPEDARAIHRWLEHFRDGVLVHTDATPSDVAGVPMHDVVYSLHGDKRQFSTMNPYARVDAYRDARKHCERMRDVIGEQLLEFHRRFKNLMPSSDGDYLLNLSPALPVFERYTRSHPIILNYK